MGTYSVDGVPLDDAQGRWRLDVGTGVRARPAFRSSATELPGRDGELLSSRENFEAGSLSIVLDLFGSSHADLMNLLSLWNGILGQKHKLLTISHALGDGRVMEAAGRVSGSMDPDLVGDSVARLPLVFTIPGVFWRDAATVDSVAAITASSGTNTLAPFAGSTGAINDALIQLRGNFAAVTLTDPVSGDRLTVNQSLASTQYLVIDTANWVARMHNSDSWSLTTGSNVISNVISNRGSGPMFTLNPDFATGAGRIRLSVHGTNPQVVPQVIVRAKRSFL